LSAILASSALSFAIVRWAGVAYLVYLAVGALHSAPIRAARALCWRCPPGGRTGRRSSHSTSIQRAAETPMSVPPSPAGRGAHHRGSRLAAPPPWRREPTCVNPRREPQPPARGGGAHRVAHERRALDAHRGKELRHVSTRRAPTSVPRHRPWSLSEARPSAMAESQKTLQHRSANRRRPSRRGAKVTWLFEPPL
jgi:hypothetical protein